MRWGTCGQDLPHQSQHIDGDVLDAMTGNLTPATTDAYRRLVEAVDRRNQRMQPVLSELVEQPEVLDEIGGDRPPTTVGTTMGEDDARTALERLRRGIDT